MTAVRSLHTLFRPRSVAVVGASEDQRKWGNWLALGALRGEQRRSVYLVNHRASTLFGRPTFASVADLPEAAELVVVTVPAAALQQTVDQALAMGTRAIVVISAGGADDAGLAARVREAGAVLLGPNCLGVLDSGQQLELVPNPLPAGPIGLISQSGNLALELGLLAAPDGLGFSRFASLGNQADLGAAELIREFAGHDETELIALYVEDFRDGRDFARAALDAVESGKPVVALAIEQGGATTRAVRSHTGALASDGAAIDAAFRAAGIQRVRTPRELIDVAQALLRAGPAPGRRLAVLADGGGHGSIAASVAGERGFTVPELSPAVADSLRSKLPSGAAVSNPVDLAGGAERDVHTFDRVALELLESEQIDALLITGYFGGYEQYGAEFEAQERRAAALIGRAARVTGCPVAVHTIYPRGEPAGELRGAGVPVYETVEQAVSALASLARAGERQISGIPEVGAADTEVSRTADSYDAARSVLSAGGVPFVAQRTVTGTGEAVTAAREIGYPVVLKALGLLHKSDAGGVVLGIEDETELRHAFTELSLRLSAAQYSVEAMAPVGDGIELLIGTRWDARFGPIALVGSGGVYTEVLRDTAVALAPVTESQAASLLRSLRAAPLLEGARGRPALDVAAAAASLAALSRVGAAHPELAELEVNPLLVTPAGALALDARLV